MGRMIRQQMTALMTQVKKQFAAVAVFIESVMKELPAKVKELRQMIMTKWTETIAEAKKMMGELIEQILTSDVYQKLVEYRMKLQKFATELIAQVKALIQKLKV